MAKESTIYQTIDREFLRAVRHFNCGHNDSTYFAGYITALSDADFIDVELFFALRRALLAVE